MKTHTCRASGCAAPATEPCFECGAWHCEAHLTTIHVPTYESSLRERVCAACCEAHLEAPGPFGPIALDAVQGPDMSYGAGW